MTWENFKKGLTDLEKGLPEAYNRAIWDWFSEDTKLKVLEVGSGWGIFARSILEQSVSLKLTTIDKKPNLDEFALRTEGFQDRIERITGPSSEELPKLLLANRKFDVVFVDGSHLYADCLNDLRLSWEMLEEGGILLVDDVLHQHNWGDDYGVAQAVWEFCRAALPTGEKVEICLVGSGGFAVIHKIDD